MITGGVTGGDWLTGGGEIGALMRAKDWSATPLGPVEAWPQSLRTAVSILLNSRYPMFIFWGPRLVKIYNDGYRPITGDKHPWALGQPGPEVWPEIWSDIGPMVERVVRDGEATWSEDLRLFMHRRGFPEEVFFTFSYSPIRDESGGVGGMFCACTETTTKVQGERRLKLLRDLAAAPAEARSVTEACALSLEVLRQNPEDIPFAEIDLGNRRGWPLGVHPVEALRGMLPQVPAGPWPEPPRSALVLSLPERALEQSAGVLVLGISSRLPFGDAYRGFFDLVAAQVAVSVANARASEEEHKRVEALAELDRAKTAFFSNVSHEFRTPLTLMLGPLADLESRAAGYPAQDRELLALARRNGQRLLKLVNTLLDFARIEAGRAQASYEPTDLASFTAELASNFRSACERAGLELTVDCAPLAAPAYVDRDMWEKIVLNLLSNAFKFTFEGGIRVSLRERAGEAQLEVSDTGIGIPAAEQPRLFERFHRIANARGRSHEGTGIGLALVQELVRLHRGSIRVESDEGRGTRFLVSVPVGSAHLDPQRVMAGRSLASTALKADAFVEEALRWLPEEAARGESVSAGLETPQETPQRSGARVLVADDNADLREYVRRLLGARYEVQAAADGAAALEAARRNAPDLIVADVMMPRMDGFALLRALRADAGLRSVPVILLSARAGEEARIEGLQQGADDYLVKPFSARELLARVESHLEIARIRRESEDALLAANRGKDEFLAMLAHELRNPLSAASIAAEILQRTDLADERARFAADVIQRQVEQLQRLVDDLLDVARAMHGKFVLASEPVELAELAREVLAPHAQRTGANATLAGPPAWALGDRARLRQILDNLIDNAVKYGGRNISVRTATEGGWASITVSDDGRGIAPELLARVFEPFVQGEQSLARPHGGLGLGLALVDRLVRLHGGSLLAESPGVGEGASFTVRLPRAPMEADAAVPQASLRAPSRRRVLIVEDQPDAGEALSLLLQLEGHDVRLAADGAQGLEAIERWRPEVALIDVGLPDMDGYEVARRVRRAAGNALKLVALTGYGQERDRADALAAGFDLHLTKPVSSAALRRAFEH